MTRVLVSGAAGFVGANLTRRLLVDGHEVHVLVRPGSDRWRLEAIAPYLVVHEADLGDDEAVARACRGAKADWIFHLAAHGAYSSQTDRRRMVRTNITGTLNLVEAALAEGFEALVCAGSSSEYGFKEHPPAETELVEPNSDYAATKASATLLCRSIAQRQRVRIQTLRLYSVYGAFEEPSRLMPTIIARGLAGSLPPLVRPEIARDYVHVDDVSEAFVLAAGSDNQEPGAVYNVGTGVQTSVGEVVELARRVLAIDAEPQWASMADRAWDTIAWVANPAKIRERLGWIPRHTLESGFAEMVEWFRDNPHYHSKYRVHHQQSPT